MPEYRTVRQAAQAMTLDPTPQIKFSLGGKYGSCAIGGAALYMGVEPLILSGALYMVPRDGVPGVHSSLGGQIVQNNDDKGMTKAEIGQQILDMADAETLDHIMTLW